jgi:hypothetical protein
LIIKDLEKPKCENQPFLADSCESQARSAQESERVHPGPVHAALAGTQRASAARVGVGFSGACCSSQNIVRIDYMPKAAILSSSSRVINGSITQSKSPSIKADKL